MNLKFGGAAQFALAGFLVCALGASAAPPPIEYLSDRPELILSSDQDWGVMGFDVAAHQPDQAGLPLQIAGRRFAKGLGHHANGAILILLDGQYASFDAEAGRQPCGGGRVIFRVLVDGQLRLDSGVMTAADPPKPLHLSVSGAQELRLEANDAGDGINCDMANWADARLTPATGAAQAQPPEAPVDIARFARLVTWDPNRNDGCRASRTEEFRAEDVFLDTDVAPNADDTFTVPVSTNGLACIGLQWLNRRALKEVRLEFAGASPAPPTNAVQVQGWFGESAWQGHWKPLAGEPQVAGHGLVFRLSTKDGFLQTQKLRWVFPVAEKTLAVRRLSAFTRSRWHTAGLVVQVENAAKRATGELQLYNGEFVGLPTEPWDLSRPLHLTVRYSRPSSFKSDPTVLQFRLPTGAFGVAVEDVLSNECVYLPDHGLFVARDPAPTTLADYKRKVAGRKTILQQVRELPDQTLAQAMAKTHHEAQREGPVLLSLACDNAKFVIEREGTIRFQAATNVAGDWFGAAGELRPQFGDGQLARLTRQLDGGWLPIPVITVEKDGVVYRERTFVAPCEAVGNDPARFNGPSVCVAEFAVTNTQANAADASLSLSFLLQSRPKTAASLALCARGYFVLSEERAIGLAITEAAAPLRATAKDGVLKLSGTLPPHGEARLAVYLPAPQTDPLALPDVTTLRRETEAYWNAVLRPTMQVETPDTLLNNLIRSSQVRCLIAARHEADGTRIAPWIAAMSYGPLESEAHSVVRGMDFLGHSEFAQRGLDFFIHRYSTNGFLTTGYTTFGTAWHLWTLGEHYQLDRDVAWLRRVAPEVARAGQWIVRETEKTKKLNARGEKVPEYGLMPPGVLADWNAFAYHFAMNAYYYAALRQMGTALTDIGDTNGARFTQKSVELRENILRAYHSTQLQSPALPLSNGAWIPHYPSQVHSPGKLADFFPGQDAGRSWCYDVEIGAHQLVPAGVFDPQDREVTRMMEHMEDVQFLAGGWFDYPAEANHKDWFNLGGFSKVQPYYTRNGEVYALRDDVKPFIRSYFNTIAAMLNPEVLTFWEHFHHSGAWDKTHETGYFLQQTRFMFVIERGDELWLAPLVTGNWLHHGMAVAVTNAPTRFGKISFRITSHVADGYMEAAISPPTRQPPKSVVLRLRHPQGKRIRSVTVNGKRHRDFDVAKDCVMLPPMTGTIVVRAKF